MHSDGQTPVASPGRMERGEPAKGQQTQQAGNVVQGQRFLL